MDVCAMSVFVTSCLLIGDDGTYLEDECSLCGAITPWLVSFTFHQFLINACIGCSQNIAKAALQVIEEKEGSKAR